MLRGFYLRFGTSLDKAVNRRIQGIAQTVLKTPHPALTDVIPGYSTLYFEYDSMKSSETELKAWLETSRGAEPAPGRLLTVSVLYDGPDLVEVAERTGLSVAEVVARHSAPEYAVYALGFTPGLAFMGDLEPALRLPRRDAPRAHVSAQSVAIANAQTTVYPVASPGGWHLLGRTLEPVYNPKAENPFLFRPGDQVRFQPVTEAVGQPAEGGLELLPKTPHTPLLRVLEPGLLDLVVDRGRFLAGHLGFARSGPLDAVSAERANRLVGNSVVGNGAGAALLELNLQGGVYEVLTDGVLAFTGGGMQAQLSGETVPVDSSFAVQRGDRLSFIPSHAGSRGYLALAGGLESRLFRGSASVDLRGRIGRALRAGDVLGTGRAHIVRAGRTFSPHRFNEGILRILPGPQASAESLQTLVRRIFTVGHADRMGVQLLGGDVPGGEVLSEAVPLGSVQVPPGGTPLLLLNDRGTLGGYAKPAVLHPADLARAAQLRPGQAVRFRLVR